MLFVSGFLKFRILLIYEDYRSCFLNAILFNTIKLNITLLLDTNILTAY